MNNKFNKKKFFQAGCFALSAVLLAPTVAAEITGNVSITSDYRFRAISQSAGNAALQGGIDYSHDNGFFAGAWASTIDFDKGYGVDDHTGADLELDVYLGYAGAISDTVEYDVTFYRYNYPGDDVSQDYNEISFGIYVGDLHVAYWYANDYGNGGNNYSYLEGNYSITLNDDWSLDFHAGYNFGEAFEYSDGSEKYDDAYVDYSIGISTSVADFDLSLAWLASNYDWKENRSVAWKSNNSLVVSATYNF